jgi:Family of unknown function (DUF6455)
MKQNKWTDMLVSPWRHLTAAFKAFWQRRASVNEIDRLGAAETRHLARDLGLSSDELRLLAATDRSAADLLGRRMDTLGLEPAHVDSMVMRDLQRCCSQCTDKVLCVHELEDRPRQAAWPKYCPNEQTLGALIIERPQTTIDEKPAPVSKAVTPSPRCTLF